MRLVGRQPGAAGSEPVSSRAGRAEVGLLLLVYRRCSSCSVFIPMTSHAQHFSAVPLAMQLVRL